VALTEPFADTSNMEFVLAGLARHLWETLIILVHNTVTNVAVFNSLNLSFNVCFPSKNSRDNISILELNDLSNS
jgi:hypothetical protein